MSESDDTAVLLLTENLIQIYCGYHIAVYNIRKYFSGADGRKLIHIADENDPAGLRKCAQERFHQGDIHHGTLIHNDSVAAQRLFLIEIEYRHFIRIRHLSPQQTMKCIRFSAGQFRHAFRSSSRWSAEFCFQTDGLECGKDRTDGGGFSCTGSSGQHGDLMIKSGGENDLLIFGIGNPLLFLYLLDYFGRVHTNGEPIAGHFVNPLSSIGFRFVNVGKIAAGNIANRFDNDLSVFFQTGKTLFTTVHIQRKQHGTGFTQLVF